MAKFNVGDRVQMPGVPFVVKVLELGQCDDAPGCDLGDETFRFADPQTGADDWMHTSDFELVQPGMVA